MLPAAVLPAAVASQVATAEVPEAEAEEGWEVAVVSSTSPTFVFPYIPVVPLKAQIVDFCFSFRSTLGGKISKTSSAKLVSFSSTHFLDWLS